MNATNKHICLWALLLAVLSSCEKKESWREEVKETVPEQLLGKWYSLVPEDGYYEIDFAPKTVRFTMAAGSATSKTVEWTDVRVEEGNLLTVYGFDAHYQQNTYYRHPFALTDDGKLWFKHLAPSIAAVIGQYPGDNSMQGEVWFGRDKVGGFPDGNAVKDRLIGTWGSTEPSEGYFRLVFSEDAAYYTKDVGISAESTEKWKGYYIEGGRTLVANRKDAATGSLVEYRHTLLFQHDGTLRVANLQRDDTMTALQASDATAAFHDVVFRRIEEE